jgi:nucleotide-binding universal stress UspA family protein
MVHTVEEPYEFAPMLEEFKKNVSRKIEKLLQDQQEKILNDSRYEDLEIDTRILYGRVATAILDEAVEVEADLIVMGTTGASGLQRVLFGSKTTEVILQSKAPVLAVPESTEFNDIEHITFLTDYSDGDLKALEDTADLAELFSAEITVLHIAEDHNLQEEIMHRGFREIASSQIKHDSINFELMDSESFEAGVSEFLDLKPTSLLTMVRYRKPFFSNLFSKDHSKELGFYTRVPLLVLIGK